MKAFKYILCTILTCFLIACDKEDKFVPVAEVVLLTQNVSGSVMVDTNKDEIGDIPLEGARVYLGDFLLINDIKSMRPDTLQPPYNDILWADVDADGNYEMNAVLEMTEKSLVLYAEDISRIFGTDVTPDGDFLETEVFGLIPITVEKDETDDGNNFVVQLINYGEASGNIQIDLDKDGVIDGPEEGAKLWLSRRSPSHDGPIGLALDNVYSDENGNYIFEKVLPGEYVISFADAVNYTVLTGIDESPDADPTHPIKEFLPVDILEGEMDSDNNFTVKPRWYNASGSVMEDTNGDGNGDTPVVKEKLELYNRDIDGSHIGSPVAMAYSDVLGNYKFLDVPVGEYVIYLNDMEDYECLSSIDLTPEVNEPTSNPSCQHIQTDNPLQDSEDMDNVFVVKAK